MSTLGIENIQHTNGTNAITINSDGSMKRGAFQAYSNSNQSLTSNVHTIVQLDQKLLDPDNYFDTSTYRFTPQVAGIYYIEGQIMWEADVNDDVYLFMNIKKNGDFSHTSGSAPYLTGSASPNVRGILSKQMKSGNESGVRASCLVHFNGSTDYVDMSGYIYNYTDASATDNLMKGHADQMLTYMLGFRVD
tara:strand:- start:30 stop:602 length:573 start_codon:yes stop_codon:yes gene_type:complete